MLQMTQQMKTKTLLDLPRSIKGIKIYPVNKGDISDGSDYILLHHIDGKYSYCKTEKGGYIHLQALTPIEEYEDGYKLMPNNYAKAS